MSEEQKKEGGPEEEEKVEGAKLKPEFREEVKEVFEMWDKDLDERIGLYELG